jgi:hypothetical protein
VLPPLRHAYALRWLRQHQGRLVEVAQLLDGESLDITAVYTRASAADLARGVEPTPFNLDSRPPGMQRRAALVRAYCGAVSTLAVARRPR